LDSRKFFFKKAYFVGSGEEIKPWLSQATNFFFFGFEEASLSRKAHFVGSGEGVKPQLSQVLTRGARPDSNSRPAVQISNPLPLRSNPFFAHGGN